MPDQNEREMLAGFKNETRKRQWLSTRILIRNMFADGLVKVSYESSGKPLMISPGGFISISHSGCFAAVMYDAERPVGVDIERLQTRIENVSCKFLSAEEAENIDAGNRVQHLVTIWAAKEAVYKLTGKSNIEFDRDIKIGQFVPLNQGAFAGTVRDNGISRDFRFRYSLIEDYVLVWVK